MAPLICLIAAFLLFRLLGLQWHYFADWQMALRAALGAVFLLTASAHWGKRRTVLVRMVPESMGNAGAWVSVTGFAEIAVAAGLQIPRIAQWIAGIGVVMLCCLFPANVKAAREHLIIFRKVAMPLVPRLVLQILFIAALIGSVSPNR
ncbi:MAG: hypothetical protein WBY75_00795 [Terracidiphilus sp.]